MQKVWKNQVVAFWLTPVVATFPLIPLFSIPSSPLFLGKLMGIAALPMNWPYLGPLFAAAAVIFNGTLLGYAAELCLIVPVYILMARIRKITADRVISLFTVGGIATSQIVHLLQHFQQPGLRAFADSWFAAALGGASGLAGGMYFVATATESYTTSKKVFSCIVPIALLGICALVSHWSG